MGSDSSPLSPSRVEFPKSVNGRHDLALRHSPDTSASLEEVIEERKHKSKRGESVESRRSHRNKERNGERHRDKRDHEDSYYERENSVDSDEVYEREKERSKDKDHKRRSKDEDRKRSRDDEKERGRDRDREKKKDRDKHKEREKDKKRDREERDKEKEREKREKEKEKREIAKEKEREKEKREREREKDRREREREKVKDKEREREKRREKEKRREVDSDDGKYDDVKDRDRKRRRRDGSEKDHERGSTRREGSPKKKSSEEKLEEKKPKVELTLEEEQLKLDDEMEKRRRRVQEWQELKRKKEESEREKGGEANAEEPKSGKAWTLEGESDDEDAPGKEETAMDTDENANPKPDLDITNDNDEMAVDSKSEMAPENLQVGDDEDEIDPLDAFMNNLVVPEVKDQSSVLVKKEGTEDNKNSEQRRKGPNKSMGRIIPGEDSESDHEDLEKDGDSAVEEDDDEFMKRVKKTKIEKLSIVDHSKMTYKPFRKNFYIEVRDISATTQEEVAAYREEMEFKIRGKDVPKPIKAWNQTGLTTKILETLKKMNFEKPMPIQAQTLPVIMSGRDCIGIAKTGSGKTLAFVLPMLRHIKDQEPVVAGDGPIALIMAPTRELVQQIHGDIRKFAKVLGLRCVPVYGGSGVAQQISDLKRGAEIVVCTPGRMIDILCTSGGKISNLRRVTYLVMDEADRMFDMGFEPQITRIVQNIQPDRQTVLFSATFPRQVEILARKVLVKPVEIQVGGRSVVNKDITQLVEVRPEKERFFRLLELLGEWYEKGKILIFVQTHERCDHLFKDLLKHGYPCVSLHGGKDQTDRESTITDFKTNVCNILVATSIAARGLDVKDLELVINYDVPNHYEDYVHRVGRTGRAGRKGCAITFIAEEDAKYSLELVKALQFSKQVIPDDLKALANRFMEKVKQGEEQAPASGFGGSGFKFNEEEEEVRKAAKKAQAKEYGFEEDKSDSEDENEGVRKAGGEISQQAALAQFAAIAAASKAAATTALPNPQLLPNNLSIPTIAPTDGAARAAALAAAMNLQHNLAKIQADSTPEHYEAELEINDFPQNARWKVTHKETLGPISEWTGAAITTRGQFFPPGRIAGPGDRKLYLFIEGPTEQSVKIAKANLKRVLEDVTNGASSLPGGTQPGKYSMG